MIIKAAGGDCHTTWSAAGTATPPPGGAITQDPGTAFQAIAAAIRQGNGDYLFRQLDPAVIARYGAAQCAAYVATIVHPTQTFSVVSIAGPSPWDWVTDGRTTTIPAVYTLTVDQTLNAVTTREEVHLAQRGNRLTWFTDCGTPR